MAADEPCAEDDIKLLQLMIAGKERGFVTLYGKYQSQVYRFALQVKRRARHVQTIPKNRRWNLLWAPVATFTLVWGFVLYAQFNSRSQEL